MELPPIPEISEERKAEIDHGSTIAKSGFQAEANVVAAFLKWKTDKQAQAWLDQLGIDTKSTTKLTAKVIKGSQKSDLQITVNDEQEFNIQLKLTSLSKGFNQLDKRWLKTYQTKWKIPQETHQLLQYFVGEKTPKINPSKDSRRMFLTEFTNIEQQNVIQFFTKNKRSIITDLFQGDGDHKPEWFMVIQRSEEENRSTLKSMDQVIAHYSQGEVKLSPRGSLEIGRVKMQRKGGDNGRPTANMLQFKIDPSQVFNIKLNKKDEE